MNTDDDNLALQYYSNLVDDNSDLMYYLKNGQIIHYDKRTKSVFIHGSINCENFLIGPGNVKYKNIEEWIRNINKWANKITTQQNIEELILYQEPDANTKIAAIENHLSLIGARPWAYNDSIKDGDKKQVIGVLSQIIGCANDVKKAGIKNILISHSPVGQVPIIIKDPNTDIITVACDTTYAGRIANIKITNKEISIKADYSSNQKLDSTCQDSPKDLILLEYSSNDPLVGTLLNKEDIIHERVVSKYPGKNEYLIVKFDKINVPTYSNKTL